MTRLNFPYFMNEQAVQYTIEAVKMVALEGWKLLPQVCQTAYVREVKSFYCIPSIVTILLIQSVIVEFPSPSCSRSRGRV